MSPSITIGPADDLISRCNRLLHNRRSVRGSYGVPELSRSRPSRNITINVWRRCFATGKNQRQSQPTENSTKGQHGRESATSRSRNSRSYGRGAGRLEDWKVGRLEEMQRKNLNRGYPKLTVWNDAIKYYAANCETFCKFPFVLQRVASQQIASVDSIHRNIAEGYCRRSLSEYLHFLSFALASAGESVSGLHAFQAAKQIPDVDFERLDATAFSWRTD
jgi:four helix bundle protein